LKSCHQYIRRLEKAEEDKHNLFGAWWEDIDTAFAKAIVREIDIVTAKAVIEDYEWLRCMPAVIWHCYGIYFDNRACGGAVVFGPEYSENLGVWDKYGYTDKLILLSRGACAHWTPRNTASYLISRAVKLLPRKYKVVTATVDSLAGEIGTIYQACNFIYVGRMRATPTRSAWKLDGRLIGSRSMRAKLGHQRRNEIPLEHIEQVSKERYFYFRGSSRERRLLRETISHLEKSYPKRLAD